MQTIVFALSFQISVFRKHVFDIRSYGSVYFVKRRLENVPCEPEFLIGVPQLLRSMQKAVEPFQCPTACFQRLQNGDAIKGEHL